MRAFAWAVARGPGWRGALAPLGRPARGLGFVYFTDALAGHAGDIVDALRTDTGVEHWVGSVGTGIVATGLEVQDEPAVAAMIADVGSYAVFSGRAPLPAAMVARFGIVHADPEAPDLGGLVADMSAKIATGSLAGGVACSRGRAVQIADEPLTGGLSGAVIGDGTRLTSRLTQGCVPFAGRFRVTQCKEHIVERLDGRPALDVLLETVGSRRSAVLVGLPVPGGAPGEYAARNLLGVDPKSRCIAIGEPVEPGDEVLFCRRDAAAAREDLARMLAEVRAAVPRPRGALYYSCVGRGEHLFGERGAELQQVRQALGEVPLVGFFCNGEIYRDRLYGYTGVLTVFE